MITDFKKTRKLFFEGTGTDIRGTAKTEDAIKLSGLDYEVVKQNLYLADGRKVEGKYATTRTDTNDVLGVVGNNYTVVQNREGFSFIDNIIGNGGADFEVAGCMYGGKQAFMLARTDPVRILDDDFDPYLLFLNSHDGSTPVKCMFTPVRVFCSNCFAIASERASVKFSIRHGSSVLDKLSIANTLMKSHTAYIDDISSDANVLATTRFTKDQFKDALFTLIKTTENASNKIKERAEIGRDELLRAYEQPDLNNFSDSAWRALQAVSDYASHYLPKRNTSNPFIYMQRVQNGEIAAMLGLMMAIIRKANPSISLSLNY